MLVGFFVLLFNVLVGNPDIRAVVTEQELRHYLYRDGFEAGYARRVEEGKATSNIWSEYKAHKGRKSDIPSSFYIGGLE